MTKGNLSQILAMILRLEIFIFFSVNMVITKTFHHFCRNQWKLLLIFTELLYTACKEMEIQVINQTPVISGFIVPTGSHIRYSALHVCIYHFDISDQRKPQGNNHI